LLVYSLISYFLEDTRTSKMFTNLSCVTSSFSVFIDRITFIRYLIKLARGTGTTAN